MLTAITQIAIIIVVIPALTLITFYYIDRLLPIKSDAIRAHITVLGGGFTYLLAEAIALKLFGFY